MDLMDLMEFSKKNKNITVQKETSKMMSYVNHKILRNDFRKSI